ncbi:uncharacterized protein Z518_09323 [Rhinocladiella mackenziei CBS 650.93]|uniref:ADP-ribosylation factor n=1 Tax=Rhinocladiella mackenziei CBS 650.93 TaxID=1442369 RepID=A0A0D2FHZ1_9EURO|nr:uncharacterized protein Z518_09323 [Rhinocladiella mackenziei CBS 650.93]KIX01597.1 hypothetical protein Z518_09323 [Rhinocladiella mackenziei CBS 650.93]
MAKINPPAARKVYNLDEETAFQQCTAKLTDPTTENFIVRFESSEAKCAVDVSQEEALKWLQAENRSATQALWLNFWTSDSQRTTIAAVAKKYGLSPRLTRLLCPARKSATQTPSTASTNSSSSSTSSGQRTPTARMTDVEKGIPPSSDAIQSKPKATVKDINFGDVVNDLWHFCSIDFGHHFIHVGFNTLFSSSESKNEDPSKPSGQRIWTSLLICDDGTVISVFDRPVNPEAYKDTRSHVVNIFRHLSKHHNHNNTLDALMQVRVRWNEPAGTGYSPTEAASLLFYYLFDDWWSTYALLARREHPYRDTLEELRQLMFEAADVSLIKQVHDVGRQLTVLKLMYQSYELIVSRLLHRQRSTKDANIGPLSAGNGSHFHDIRIYHDTAASQLAQDEHIFLDEDSMHSVKLSFSAVVRFERLLDRIRLYALTEIEECLKEKESLVLMNFNLVALKESQAVERLTRTTVLLAKATILFLPVSLMTGYFSIQLPEVAEKYTLKTYWLSFLVVSLLSMVFLLVFGVTTHTVEGKTIYRSITGIILDKGKRKKQ